MNFLIQLKRSTIPQLRNSILIPSQSASVTSAIKITRNNAKTVFLRFYSRQEKVSNLLTKVDIHQQYDRNETSISSTYRIALLTKKNKIFWKRSAIKKEQIVKTFISPQLNFRNNFRNYGGCRSHCHKLRFAQFLTLELLPNGSENKHNTIQIAFTLLLFPKNQKNWTFLMYLSCPSLFSTLSNWSILEWKNLMVQSPLSPAKFWLCACHYLLLRTVVFNFFCYRVEFSTLSLIGAVWKNLKDHT